MANLELFLLGSPQIYVDGQAVTDFNTRKDRALLAYLAVTGTMHSREALAGLLWSELPEDKARRNLRHALSHLQKVIGPQWLTTERGVALTKEQPWSVDVQTLRSTVKGLDRQPTREAQPTGTQALDALNGVLDLYRGEFLQGFYIHHAVYFEEWVVAQREESRSLALRGLEMLVERCLAQGAYDKGIVATRRLIQLEPWSETAYCLQMKLLAQSGRRTDALAQYERCRQILATELGVEPLPETTALYLQIRDQPLSGVVQPAPVSVQPSVPITPPTYFVPTLYHNLPGQLTLFIGRSDDIIQIRMLLLSPQNRLVTVVGEGGVGKTRVALAVAQSFVDETQALANQSATAINARTTGLRLPFPDGIVLVPLAGLTATETLVDQLVATVAKAMRIQVGSKEPLLQQLQDHLRDKAVLLIFDNFEHLLPEAADFLVALLQSCPQLKLLVTSRHLLNLQSESITRLAGLPIPPPEDAPTLTPSTLLAYSSVALFAERAQRVNVNFQVTGTNQAEIVQICRFVEGLPLAIELAATLTRQYTCQQILVELQESYLVLSSTLRDLAPRHRSMRAVLDYSWQFLAPQTAQLLTACSIFQGSFGRTAAAVIMAATPDALFTLVDQSLLQLLPNSENTDHQRFAMHELIRQYATDQLQTQPAEIVRLRTAHAVYYLTLLIEQSSIFVHDPRALQQVQNEIDNLRAAWAWAGAHGQFDLLTASAYPLTQFYHLLGLYHEGESAFGRAITQVWRFQAQTAGLETPRELVLANLQAQQAYFCARLEQSAQAEALAQAALEIGNQYNDHAVQAYAYLYLSLSYGNRTDWASEHAVAQQALVHARAAALTNVEAASLQDIATTYASTGDLPQALDYFHQAMATIQTIHNLDIEGTICFNLGIVYQLTSDLMQARAYYQQAVKIFHQMNIPFHGAHATLALCELHLQLGLFAQAIVDAQAAWAISRQVGLREVESMALGCLAHAHYRLDDLAKADYYCQAMFDRVNAHGLTLDRPFAYLLQGDLQCSQRLWQAALVAYAVALPEYRATEQMDQVISAQARIAQVWLQIGDLAKALVQVEEILPYLSQTLQSSWRETSVDFLTCYQVLAAAGDPRATAILQKGYQHINRQAANLTDAALCQSYLENVAENRALVELAVQAGMG